MSDDSYTKNEINLMMVPIHDKLESIERQQNASFQTVISKQDKTNGRVKSLELWRSFLAGGFAVLSLSGAWKLVITLLESGVKP